MATFILTEAFRISLEKQEVIDALSSKGFVSTDAFLQAILKRLNQFDSSLNLKSISYHILQGTDTYIGIILDEYLNKLYNVCVIPPVLGTRSGFISQQIFGFISNLINGQKNKDSYSLCDKPVIIVNCMTDSLADSAICNIIGTKIMGFNYIDIFNRDKDFGNSNLTLSEFIDTVSKYKDISKDIELASNTLSLKTERLKDFKTSLTNEPYYFAITAYPAVILAKKEDYTIDISDFETKFLNGQSNKNINAFLSYVKRIKVEIHKPISVISTQNKSLLIAIKTKPFLILGGFSGTGKSQKVKELAYLTCPIELQGEKTPGNYALISVKPNWHDSTELLGYESTISGKYMVTDFMRFIVKAMQHPNTPFFCCMDEMNLAHVEEYFAEYLSVLESRKKVYELDENGDNVLDGNDNKVSHIVSEPLVSADVFTKTYKENIFEALGLKKVASTLSKNETKVLGSGIAPSKEQFEREDIVAKLMTDGLCIPENLVVIGTVNMDDTTKSFSRKVIDRAMIFETDIEAFEVKKYFDAADSLQYGNIDGKAFICDEVRADKAIEDGFELSDDEKQAFIDYMNELNKAMAGTSFQVSYRVLNEMILYYRSMKMLNDGVADVEQVKNDILMMKVLPRIEGDSAAKTALEGLKTLIEGQPAFPPKWANLEYNIDAETIASMTPTPWKESILKISYMLHLLESGDGFTRFWK